MAIKTGMLFDMGDPDAPRGTLPWIKAVHEKAKVALKDASISKEHAQTWVEALREDDNFRKLSDVEGRPFMLWEDFCTTAQPRGLGYAPEAIEQIIAERQSVEAL